MKKLASKKLFTKPRWLVILVILLAAGLIAAEVAMPLMPRSLVSSGGGGGEGGGVALVRSALGQSAAGVAISPDSNFILCAGFVCGKTNRYRVYLPIVLR